MASTAFCFFVSCENIFYSGEYRDEDENNKIGLDPTVCYYYKCIPGIFFIVPVCLVTAAAAVLVDSVQSSILATPPPPEIERLLHLIHKRSNEFTLVLYQG